MMITREPQDILSACSIHQRQSKKFSFLSKRRISGSFPLLISLALSCTPTLAESPEPLSKTNKPQSTHIDVKSIKSAKKITAWIVENHEIPVVSVAIAFKNAGSTADPKGLAGLVQLLSGMLDEGAGEWDSQGFKKFLLAKNIELNISASQDTFQISFRTIKANIGEAFRVLKIILSNPRFDEAPLSRVKNQILSMLEQSLHNERTIVSQKLSSLIYGEHPYGKTIQQILKEFPAVTDSQLRQFMKERFALDQLLISIVGDITPNEAKNYLDKTFGDFPQKAIPTDVKDATLLNMGTTVVETLDIPQSLVLFTQPGIRRSDPRFYASLIMMNIMGDGVFESRLWNEVREKRGLAYGIDADLSWSQHATLVLGNTATNNANVKDVIDIIRNVWKEMQTQGATQAELDFVKKRMIGSFALNFSSTIRIAKALLIYQIDNLDISYINKRNEILSALTLDDINKASKSLLKPELLTFVIVGKPQGLPVQEPTQENSKGV